MWIDSKRTGKVYTIKSVVLLGTILREQLRKFDENPWELNGNTFGSSINKKRNPFTPALSLNPKRKIKLSCPQMSAC
jgi:hypothetical protein